MAWQAVAQTTHKKKQTIAGTAAAVVVTLAGSPAGAKDNGWVLTQKSFQLGDQYVYVTSTGVKCYNPRAGIALVTHGPEWMVTVYNEKTRVYFTSPLEQWERDMAARGFSSKSGGTWNRAGATKICGLRATVFHLDGGGTYHSKDVSGSVSSATCYVSDDIHVPPQLINMVATAYGLPATTSLPLKVTAIERGASKNLLETYRAQTSPIPLNYFDVPTGLTLVKSDAEVMMTAEQKQIVNDMARELDTDSPRGAPRRYGSSPATGETITVGGMNLDKGKVKQFIDGLKNGGGK